MRFLVVDDHPMARACLAEYARLAKKGCIVDEAGDGQAALSLLEKNRYSLVIIDVYLNDTNGVELFNRMKQIDPALKVILITGLDSPTVIRLARDGGADGFVLKKCVREEIVKAIRTVLRGGTYMSNGAEVFLKNNGNSETSTGKVCGQKVSRQKEDFLSERERDVFSLFLAGRTAKEISRLLKITPKTVYALKYRIRDKLAKMNDPRLALFD